VTLLLLLALAQGGDWTRFRGPTGDGIAPPEADPPVEWGENKNVAWKTELPGRGRSSPLVLGGRVLMTTAVERGVVRRRIGPDDMQVAEHVALGALAVDAATGKLLWHVVLREIPGPDPVHWFNSWATPTPVAEPGRFVCDFGGWGTWCLDPETGKVLWEKKIPLDHQVGPGSSLGLHEGRVLLVRDGRDAQVVAALDVRTGEQVWRTERPPVEVGSPNQKKSFSSPIVVRSGGADQMVAIGPHWAAGYEPATGREIWRLRHGQGYSIGAAPVFGDGTVYFSTGCAKATLCAVRADGTGDVSSTLLWRSSKGVPVMSSPLLAGGDLYWVSDDGIATCAAAKDGAVRWQERVGGAHYASPILAAGRVHFFDRDGRAVVLKPGPAYEPLAENRLDGTVFATPAVSGKALFVRTDTHLYRLERR
jgi:hypothetical protein